jgi:hypothetical protein
MGDHQANNRNRYLAVDKGTHSGSLAICCSPLWPLTLALASS